MNDHNLKPGAGDEIETKTQIHVNEYGATKDPTVVVDEPDRTVLLTENETIIIPKEPTIDVPPKNRARKVYGGMWGTAEMVSVGLGLLAILATVVVFVLLVLPAQKGLSDDIARRDELAAKRETEVRRAGTAKTTKERVGRLIESVDDFESRFLSNETVGKAALYQQLNGLLAAYNLTNTSGPDYAPLEINDQNRNQQQSEAQKGRSKFLSIYPGVYVSMTVDGPYQNLRRFIREIETGNQFVVISSVELEPSEEKDKKEAEQNAPPAVAQNQPVNPIGNPVNYKQPGPVPTAAPEKADRGKTRGETVTLRIELAAYFRRPNGLSSTQTAALNTSAPR
ncbi:MAG: hypothetical protein JSS81_06480 [Acidobacteria bacterium]|nr:hypothetical protein [Acidobacteriota bacterium]